MCCCMYFSQMLIAFYYVYMFMWIPLLCYCVLCLPLSIPTLPAAPPWQRWECQASTNAVEGRHGGLEARGSTLSCWWKTMSLWCTGEEEETTLTSFFPPILPINPPVAQSSHCCSLLCWLLWLPWRPVSGGLDFLTKPSGPRAVTVDLGQCARPKLTQLTLSQNHAKKRRPNCVFVFSHHDPNPLLLIRCCYHVILCIH